MPNPSYICPNCADWIEILPTTNTEDFKCPWCNERMRLDADGDFEDGIWHDRSKIVTFRSHFDDKV